MWCRNAPPFDNHYWLGDPRRHWLKNKRPYIRPGMRSRRGKRLVIGMAQHCHVVSYYQDKVILKRCQRSALLTLAGTAQQMQLVIW